MATFGELFRSHRGDNVCYSVADNVVNLVSLLVLHLVTSTLYTWLTPLHFNEE